MESPRVLMQGWGYPPEIEGGLDIHVAEVFQALRDAGVDAQLVLPAENAPEGEHFIGVETGEGDMVERARKLSRSFVHEAEDYEVVHTHDWFGAESGLKAKKHSGCAWVASFHSLAGSRTRNPSRRIERMEEACVERSDALTAVSDLLAAEIEQRHGRRPRTVRNSFSTADGSGIDARGRHGIEQSRDLVLYVGRLAEQKNVEILLRAVADLDAELLIAGEGHRREALETLAAILGIERKVHFAGFVDAEELGDYYAAADLFVSPSRNEPFGLTITEALQSGTRVVATESGATELVEEGVVEAEKNSDSLRQRIEEALESEPEIQLEERTWTDVAREYMDIYSELAK